VSRDSDDDALNWAGDDDPTLVARAADPDQARLAPGWRPVGEPGRIDVADDAEASVTAPDEPGQASSATLITLGVLGGLYLIYTIGWAVVATRVGTDAQDAVPQFMFTLGNWLAVLAVPLWFVTTLWLTREHQRARLAWLFAGVVLLLPLPFLLGTGVAA
jgi:hypothetical protein